VSRPVRLIVYSDYLFETVHLGLYEAFFAEVRSIADRAVVREPAAYRAAVEQVLA